MPFHKYILNFLHCNVFAQKKLVAMTFEVTHIQLEKQRANVYYCILLFFR